MEQEKKMALEVALELVKAAVSLCHNKSEWPIKCLFRLSQYIEGYNVDMTWSDIEDKTSIPLGMAVAISAGESVPSTIDALVPALYAELAVMEESEVINDFRAALDKLQNSDTTPFTNINRIYNSVLNMMLFELEQAFEFGDNYLAEMAVYMGAVYMPLLQIPSASELGSIAIDLATTFQSMSEDNMNNDVVSLMNKSNAIESMKKAQTAYDKWITFHKNNCE